MTERPHNNSNSDARQAAQRANALIGARNAARRSGDAPTGEFAEIREGAGGERGDYGGRRERRHRGESAGDRRKQRRRPENAQVATGRDSKHLADMHEGPGRATASTRSGGRHGRHANSTSSEAGTQKLSLVEFLKRNSVYVLSVVGVAAITILMIAFLRMGAAPANSAVEAVEHPTSESPFDWTRLRHDAGRVEYVVDGQVKSRLGIDVSESQHSIDWPQVAADGIDFAMIRLGYRGATEGELYLDDHFDANFEGAQAAGIDCGVYFFSQACTVEEAVEEADFVLNKLNGAQLAYPIAFDSETITVNGVPSRTDKLSMSELTAIAEAFCERIEAAGYRTFVYGNMYDLARYDRELIDRYQLWWAEYGPLQPSAQIDIAMWQYSNGGSIAGIQTAVDMNIDLSALL